MLYKTLFFKDLNVRASVAGLQYDYNNKDLIYTPIVDVGVINTGHSPTIITSISLYVPENDDLECRKNAPNTWQFFIGTEDKKTRAAPIVVKPNEASVTRILFQQMSLLETITDDQKKTYHMAVTVQESNQDVVANQCIEIVYINMFGAEKKMSTPLNPLTVWYPDPKKLYFGQSVSGFTVVDENSGWF